MDAHHCIVLFGYEFITPRKSPLYYQGGGHWSYTSTMVHPKCNCHSRSFKDFESVTLIHLFEKLLKGAFVKFNIIQKRKSMTIFRGPPPPDPL